MQATLDGLPDGDQPAPPNRRSRRRIWLVGAGTIVLVVIGGLLWPHFGPPSATVVNLHESRHGIAVETRYSVALPRDVVGATLEVDGRTFDAWLWPDDGSDPDTAPERVRARLGQSGQLNFSVIPDCTAPMPGTVGDYVVQTDTGEGTASEVIALSGITSLPALAEAWCELGVVAALSKASSAANGSWLRAEYTLQNASAETALVTLEHGWQPKSITVKPGTPAVLKVIAPDGCRGDANLTATATFVSGSDQAVRFEPPGRQVC